MFVDASAIVAILSREVNGKRLVEILDSRPKGTLVTNVIAVWEVVAALRAKRGGALGVVESEAMRFLDLAGIEILPVGPNELPIALTAFDRYGRHRYADPKDRNKGLNLADCFHYATVQSRRIAILTTDEGFAATDLEMARID